jgi:hypothetical protein
MRRLCLRNKLCKVLNATVLTLPRWCCLLLHCSACRDETTVLALNGLGKVLKANMATVLTLPGFDEKWDEICSIAARVLCCGRKSVAVAAAQLLTGFLQVRPGTDAAFLRQ